jgi:hypothetical protein
MQAGCGFPQLRQAADVHFLERAPPQSAALFETVNSIPPTLLAMPL